MSDAGGNLCRGCNSEIPEADIQNQHAVRVGTTWYCRKCRGEFLTAAAVVIEKASEQGDDLPELLEPVLNRIVRSRPAGIPMWMVGVMALLIAILGLSAYTGWTREAGQGTGEPPESLADRPTPPTPDGDKLPELSQVRTDQLKTQLPEGTTVKIQRDRKGDAEDVPAGDLLCEVGDHTFVFSKPGFSDATVPFTAEAPNRTVPDIKAIAAEARKGLQPSEETRELYRQALTALQNENFDQARQNAETLQSTVGREFKENDGISVGEIVTKANQGVDLETTVSTTLNDAIGLVRAGDFDGATRVANDQVKSLGEAGFPRLAEKWQGRFESQVLGQIANAKKALADFDAALKESDSTAAGNAINIYRGIAPDETDRINELAARQEQLRTLNELLTVFAGDYRRAIEERNEERFDKHLAPGSPITQQFRDFIRDELLKGGIAPLHFATYNFRERKYNESATTIDTTLHRSWGWTKSDGILQGEALDPVKVRVGFEQVGGSWKIMSIENR